MESRYPLHRRRGGPRANLDWVERIKSIASTRT
jgi:hypothetical protein